MIPEREIWCAALAMVRRYTADAMLEAAARADQLLEDGDWQVAETWHRILDAIERLQVPRRRKGRMCGPAGFFSAVLRKADNRDRQHAPR
jgi:hypothetical protein